MPSLLLDRSVFPCHATSRVSRLLSHGETADVGELDKHGVWLRELHGVVFGYFGGFKHLTWGITEQMLLSVALFE